jgi:hypothetical protein
MNLRSMLSAAKVLTGLNPALEGNPADKEKYIPEGFKAVCLISADFEMAWAFLHSRLSSENTDRALKLGQKTRDNISVIIDLCDQYNIPITWATVGHIFLDRCNIVNGIRHGNLQRIPYFENKFWKYNKGDWFDQDPCTDIDTNPEFYGRDLVLDIMGRRTKHEIGCHTFSHIDCSDGICPDKVFAAEISECIRLADEMGIKLKSFVHPGHQIGHLEMLSEMGFESYRTNEADILGNPHKHKSGLWELRNTAEIKYRQNWSEAFNLCKFRMIIDKAMKKRKVCVLWFHPSFDNQSLQKIFKPVLAYLSEKRKDIWITTHKEYIEFLNSRQFSK